MGVGAAEGVVVGPAPPGFDRFDLVLALLRRAFAAHAGRIDPPSSSTRDTPQSLRALADSGRLYLGLAAEGEVAGCVFGSPRGDAWYLCKLAVEPAFQGRGLGRQLVAALVADARAAGFAQVTLAVRLALPENIALFAGLGFVTTGETCHPGYTTPTSQDMALTL
ncbi:MAG: GNAT family N-acetyltransferase [Alphaproteobacteria bacterium]